MDYHFYILMKKNVSPGFLWAIFLMMSLLILIKKYQTEKNFFTFNFGYLFILLMFIICSFYTYYFDRGKSRIMPLASFLFGVAFWIPLLNLIFAVFALYFGIASLKKISHKPKRYGGKWFAIIGIILGLLVYITYFIGFGMCFYGNKDICGNMGLSFLAK